MKKLKQILALIGVVILVLLYVSTLVLAIADHSSSMKLFQISIVATILVPVLIWALQLFYQGFQRDKKERDEFVQSIKDNADTSVTKDSDSDASTNAKE